MTPATPSASAVSLWSAVSGALQQTLAEPTYSAWFGRALPRRLDEAGLELEVPNEFIRGWISGHFMELVTEAAQSAHGAPLAVTLVVGDELDDESPEPAAASAPTPALPRSAPSSLPTPAPAAVKLNRNATFDTFVIGPSNRFAHAACPPLLTD
jgi:chromosomal replication initiator protein